MEHGKFRCCHCRRLHRRRTKDQQYCSDKACQRARRNRWRRKKFAHDADYRENQRASTQAWLEAQGGSAQWYREYRRRRRESTGPETRKSREFPGAPTATSANEVPDDVSANSDAIIRENPVMSGAYILIATDHANSDPVLVELLVVSDS